MSENETKRDYVPFEQTHRLRPLIFVTTIVSDGQADAIIQLNNEQEAAICFVCRGKGTISAELAFTLKTPVKKDVVFSIMRADRWVEYKKHLEQRFSVSKMAKGIAYYTPLASVAGVSIYKMLSNTRLFEQPTKAVNKKERKAQ